MATEAAARSTAAGAVPAASWPTVRQAGRVVILAVALGIAGQLLLIDVGLGVNFPIAIGLLLLAGWRVRGRSPSLRGVDAWMVPAALAFATFAAIRADPTIVTLDVLTALALAGGALATFGGLPVWPRPFARLVALGPRLTGWVIGGALPALVDAQRQRSRTERPAADSPLIPLLRGIGMAVPIALVFIGLFAAADAVFADVIGNLVGFEFDLGKVIARTVVAAIIAWAVAGLLALAAAEHSDTGKVPAVSRRAGLGIGSVEALTILVAVVVVFAVFVGLQAAYLFGGRDTLEATGLTYSDYARRGFFELVVVAVLAGGLVIGLERLVRRRTDLVVACAIGLVILTFVVLASAALRMRLYQEAYGWTELRFYVLATIGFLAIGGIALLAFLLADRVRWMGHALIGAALAVGLVLNLIGPARFITEQNVARALDPSLVPAFGSSGLDAWYVLALGDDAVPALISALEVPIAEDDDFLGLALAERLDELRREDGLNSWQAWNAGREAARVALEAAEARGDLPR